MLDVKKLYRDYNIQFWESGKNVSPGWVNIRCPFCGDQSNHLGFSPQGNYVCWRCGSHSLRKVLSRILGVDPIGFKNIIVSYGGMRRRKDEIEEQVRIGSRKFKLPSGTESLGPRHRAYLHSRNFDDEKLEREWGLVGTGPISQLDNIDFKHRIIAPILWYDRTVSFQARDYTGKSNLRYITCPQERELVHHKNILYGKQEEWRSIGICVEGITDVWRLGPSAFATFGINYTPAQVHEMKRFEQVFVVFDDEPQAQEQANKLVFELCFHGISAESILIDGDPGDLSQDDADCMVKELHRVLV